MGGLCRAAILSSGRKRVFAVGEEKGTSTYLKLAWNECESEVATLITLELREGHSFLAKKISTKLENLEIMRKPPDANQTVKRSIVRSSRKKGRTKKSMKGKECVCQGKTDDLGGEIGRTEGTRGGWERGRML